MDGLTRLWLNIAICNKISTFSLLAAHCDSFHRNAILSKEKKGMAIRFMLIFL